ncbi:MAG: GTP pyrophosphokinase [Proteobacteria bacterium]|nr:GTP pyrophosphokinase [Pseudomonadota bacterium]
MKVNDLVEQVQSYSQDADIRMIVDAYLYSAQAHDGQTRKSGEAYLTHPLAVAFILAEMLMDVDTIATGLLHDTMEDCMTTHHDLKERFGEDVADLVDGVTKIGKLQFRSKEEAQAENFRKMVLAMSKDIRVVLVKLADRLHNMRTMQHMKPDRQKAISQETMEIYAPIANRLGLSRLKSELEDLCFRYLEPTQYKALTEDMEKLAPDHQEYIVEFTNRLQNQLIEQCPQVDIYGRVKHLVSIQRKMVTQSLSFEQVHDLLAFRVIVENIGECYAVLGLIHGLYPHHPNKLKDYIAQPKSNGYQSLHTVILPEGRQIEVQIRTRQMHRVAELGIAAHWRYKEGHLALSSEDIQKIAKLRALFEAARDVTDPTEFLETVKVDLFSMEIFVFTPNGDVKILPKGATALDFAYTIHTDIGNQCIGAKIDGRMVSIKHELKNGDRVEILTSSSQRPSRDWIKIAKTGRALSKIRRMIREEERLQGVVLGQEMLEKELGKHSLSFSKLVRDGTIKEATRHFGHRKPEQLYLAIASGTSVLGKVVRFIAPETETKSSTFSNFINRFRSRSTSPVLINGHEDVMTSFARCCNPLPGENIAGFITRGRGISIHRSDCSQLLSSDPDCRINVQWHNGAQGQHTSELEIICNNKMGMLAELGAACKTHSINITRMEATTLTDNKARLSLEISVQDISQLKRLTRTIRQISGVLRIDRVYNR